jgi:uncharacterized protein (TIGR03435 family)
VSLSIFRAVCPEIFWSALWQTLRAPVETLMTLDYADNRVPSLDAADAAGPSLFTALREQPGLESRKGPVEVFVIDHAERPFR